MGAAVTSHASADGDLASTCATGVRIGWFDVTGAPSVLGSILTPSGPRCVQPRTDFRMVTGVCLVTSSDVTSAEQSKEEKRKQDNIRCCFAMVQLECRMPPSSAASFQQCKKSRTLGCGCGRGDL